MKKYKYLKIIFIAIFVVFSLFLPKNILAQNAVSLSVTPPLLEVMIKPGKEVKQVYTITNNGGETTLTAKIVYFETSDENGNVNLTEAEAPEWVRYSKDPIKIKSGDRVDFSVLISPSETEEELDHFLTLIFETSIPTDILSQNATFYQSQIGTNLLVTISKDGNPKKSADIVEFKAPKLIDSFLGDLKYDIKLKNSGNSFWKPNGKITINDEKILKIASVNLISGTVRNIPCIENENLTDCRYDRSSLFDNFYIGSYKADLEFSIDDDPKIYKGSVTTTAFPFTGLVLILFLLTLVRYKAIFNRWQRRK